MASAWDKVFAPRRALGRTGFVATALGIGDLADRALPREAGVRTLRRALDAGLNVIDTAPAYEDGYSEELVGEALRGRRDGVFVVDKVDHLDRPVRPQVDASLRRLRLEGADLFVLHAVPDAPAWRRLAAPGGAMDALGECIRQGKARFRGISTHDPAALREALESGLCDVVLFPIGPHVDRRYLEEALPLARARGVGTIGFKTFGAGRLVAQTAGYGKPLPAGAAETALLTPAECLRYTLSVDPDVALLGLSTPAEQDAAFRAARDARPLDSAAMHRLRLRAAAASEGKGTSWWNPPIAAEASDLGKA
jgi:1-deoxyxylulose-5-phosphate synthase